jgi:hypothetical protein
MLSSNEQVKKKPGRPLKNGSAPLTTAERSRVHRRKKQENAAFGITEAHKLARVLTDIVVKSADSGIINHDVARVLYDNPFVIKYIVEELKPDGNTTVYKVKLLKSLRSIAQEVSNTSID